LSRAERQGALTPHPAASSRRLALRRLPSAPLPRGRGDLLRQIAIFAGFYAAYELVRAAVAAHPLNPGQPAFADADRIIRLEHALHIFVEPSLQGLALHHESLLDASDFLYLNGHFLVTLGVLIFLYTRHNRRFPCVRNSFMIAMAIALVGYALYPTAPPRLMPGYGFVDTIRRFTGVDVERGTGSAFLNLYAAVPSMHVCFALLTALPMARLSARPALRLLWYLYPVAVIFAVIATGNHFVVDVLLGMLTFALSTALAERGLARLRPEAWSFREAVG
jgi:hypothetical protein